MSFVNIDFLVHCEPVNSPLIGDCFVLCSCGAWSVLFHPDNGTYSAYESDGSDRFANGAQSCSAQDLREFLADYCPILCAPFEASLAVVPFRSRVLDLARRPRSAFSFLRGGR